MQRFPTERPAQRVPIKPKCPNCSEPLDYEAAGDDLDPMGRGQSWGPSWSCVECGVAWSVDAIDDHRRECERVARAKAKAIADVAADALGQPKGHPGTRRLADDLTGGAA